MYIKFTKPPIGQLDPDFMTQSLVMFICYFEKRTTPKEDLLKETWPNSILTFIFKFTI